MPIARTLGNTLSLQNYTRFAALLGPAKLKDLVFTARLMGAEEAKATGLVIEVTEPGQLMPRGMEIARQVAGHAPLTLRAAKKALGAIRPDISPALAEEINLMCYLSEDFREGVEAFLAKRSPRWTGE